MDTGSKCNYMALSTPEDYICSKCGAIGVKLWRKYQTVLAAQKLFCGPCALKNQNISSPISANGRIFDSEFNTWCDQIGWLIPAVPTEENDTFWGYTSVPQPGVEWWLRLPIYQREEG